MENCIRLKRGELIGLYAEVVESKNKDAENIKGKIVDETKNLLKIRHNKKIKSLIKENYTFEITLGEKKIKINGKELKARPEERTKKFR